ncbi:unnamed protein product [Cyprideis torosa]|uniref:Uncharacterized protein n=1 Tax=Cyprideis torosa TaxID=163714 RepID=A0A7R8ZPL7_9CRUS|nr:unnamed protein product [Cyprideis torosa]CAG0888661.1 unnamed protein product [Cyprideis torosa]
MSFTSNGPGESFGPVTSVCVVEKPTEKPDGFVVGDFLVLSKFTLLILSSKFLVSSNIQYSANGSFVASVQSGGSHIDHDQVVQMRTEGEGSPDQRLEGFFEGIDPPENLDELVARICIIVVPNGVVQLREVSKAQDDNEAQNEDIAVDAVAGYHCESLIRMPSLSCDEKSGGCSNQPKGDKSGQTTSQSLNSSLNPVRNETR